MTPLPKPKRWRGPESTAMPFSLPLSALAEGFGLGASLIIAIGAQNAHVLRLGLLRLHVLPVVLFGAISDALFILLGALGLASLVRGHPEVLRIITFGGAAFLGWYALSAARRALHPGRLEAADEAPPTLAAALGTMAAVTLLNPHVYLDTVVLMGGLSARYPLDDRSWFVGGAMLASAAWFTALGYGARLLAPLFRKPMAWRVLDALIALVMASIALRLLMEGLES